MSSAFVREGGGRPQVFSSREAAESIAELQRVIEREFAFEVRARERGGFMVARLDTRGEFDSWVEE